MLLRIREVRHSHLNYFLVPIFPPNLLCTFSLAVGLKERGFGFIVGTLPAVLFRPAKQGPSTLTLDECQEARSIDLHVCQGWMPACSSGYCVSVQSRVCTRNPFSLVNVSTQGINWSLQTQWFLTKIRRQYLLRNNFWLLLSRFQHCACHCTPYMC